MSKRISRRVFLLGAATLGTGTVLHRLGNIDKQLPVDDTQRNEPAIIDSDNVNSITPTIGDSQLASEVVTSTPQPQEPVFDIFAGLKSFAIAQMFISNEGVLLLDDAGNLLPLVYYKRWAESQNSLISQCWQQDVTSNKYQYLSLNSWWEKNFGITMTGQIVNLANSSMNPYDPTMYFTDNMAYSDICVANNVVFVRTSNNQVFADNDSAGLPNNTLADVLKMVSSGAHVLFLLKDGSVVAWGANDKGESIVPSGLTDVVDIAAGGGFSVALKRDGSVVSWGEIKSTVDIPLQNIWAGWGFIVGVDNEKMVHVWGDQNQVDLFVPENLGKVKIVAVNDYIGVVTEDNRVVVWKIYWKANPDLDIDLVGMHSLPWQTNESRILFDSLTFGNYAQIYAYPSAVAIVTNDHSSVLFGSESKDDTDLDPGKSSFSYFGKNTYNGHIARFASANPRLGITTENKIFVFVKPDKLNTTIYMYRDTSELFQYTKLTNLADIEGLSGGYIPVLQNYILKKDGTVVWYPDDEAYIPDPYADFTPNLRDVVAIDAGYFYHVALRRDGTVLAWGKNTECVNVPLGLKDVTKVVAGCHHVLALKSDGTVVVWGNDFGYDTLQIPNGITNVVDIAASKDNYSAMMENIELYDNYVNDSERPIAGHNMVVTADGKVYAWGNNSYGQCDIPAGLPPVKSVACASQYSMVLTNDNRIFCWGQLNMII